LVVSTREPGTKRSLDCDSQTETVLNGIPDVKVHESDVSLLHVPTELPYLGAPPASNDVTVETSEPSSTIQEKIIGHMNGDSPRALKLKSEDTWPAQESTAAIVLQERTTETAQISDSIESKTSLSETKDVSDDPECDRPIDTALEIEEHVNLEVQNERLDGEGSSDMSTQNIDTVLPHSVHSDLPQEFPETSMNSESDTEKGENVSDENEVSSTPGDNIEDVPAIQESVEEPSDSEAEATDASSVQDIESDMNSAAEADTNSNDTIPESDDLKSITISEVTVSKSDEVFLECSEITGTVDSPESPDNSSSVQVDSDDQHVDLKTPDTIIEECEQSESHPDSTTKASPIIESQNIETSSEPDSVSGTDSFSDISHHSDSTQETPIDQTNSEAVVESISQIVSPGVVKDETVVECTAIEKPLDNRVLSSNLLDEALVSEVQSSAQSTEDFLKEAEVESTSEVALEFSEQEKREESVIQTTNITSVSPEQISVEEELTFTPRLPVDSQAICEPEEAMDVDDTSNQMMISEGENEGEPMDESDQVQS